MDEYAPVMLELLHEGVVVLDDRSRVISANPAALEILGVSRAALEADDWWTLLRPRRRDGSVPDLPADLRLAARDVPVRIRRPDDGRRRLLRVSQREHPGGSVLCLRDCTDQERDRRRLEQLVMRDELTGLPNRAAVLVTLEAFLAQGASFVVLLIDVDGFRAVNTGVGQAAGDAVLREIGGRLRAVLPRSAEAARFGGDDFLVVAPASGREGAQALAERVLDAFSAPFMRAEGMHLTASVGLAMGDAAPDGAGLVAAAEAALALARSRGRGLVRRFDADLRRRTDDRRALVADLRGAIEADTIAVAYQPIVGFLDGREGVCCVEALARWEHPEHGAIPPARFIALAEEAGLIRALGRRVLARACTDVAGLRAELPDGDGLQLAVNVSARQVASGLLEADVRSALNASGLEPEALGLELTETALMDDAGPTVDALTALRRVGVRLVLDDFGTGYSSLGRLRGLPLDGLKIDRSFITGVGSLPVDTAIVEAVVTMATALGLSVVAEGIETPTQLRRLRELGCTHGQGYLLGRPMELADLRARLLERPAALRSVRANR